MSEVGGSFIPVSAVHDRDGPPGSFAPLGPEIKVLLVWPRFPPSFWGFEGMLEIIPESSIMPPLGLITVAALCPAKWQLRLIDRAFEPLTDEDLNWARFGNGQRNVRAAGGRSCGAVAGAFARAAHVHRRTVGQQPTGSARPRGGPRPCGRSGGHVSSDCVRTGKRNSTAPPCGFREAGHDPQSFASIRPAGTQPLCKHVRAIFARLSLPMRVL